MNYPSYENSFLADDKSLKFNQTIMINKKSNVKKQLRNTEHKRQKSTIERSLNKRTPVRTMRSKFGSSSALQAGAVSERLFDDATRRRINQKLKVQYEIDQENKAIESKKMSQKSKEIVRYQRQRPLQDRVQKLLQQKHQKI